MSVDGRAGMQVPPHPHIGLQTVTWLFAGNVLHRDSLGSEQMIRPGQLNLMTAGRGIAHAEESPVRHDPDLHGVQLWVALPDASRHTAPGFEHHAVLPGGELGGLAITVFAGDLAGRLAGERSPATMFSPIIGAELTAARRGSADSATNQSATNGHAAARLPLEPSFEHVIFVVAGSATVAGQDLEPGRLLYLSTGREHADVAAAGGSRLILLGGEPLGEPLLMWWNFVARTPEEIAAATADWRASKFGTVGGFQGEPLPAPPLDVARLRAPHH
jgi:hypothetical protein